MIAIAGRLAVTALIFFGANVAKGSITDCSKGASYFKPTDLALSPDPPQLGQPLYMTVKFDNPGADVTGGTVSTSVTLNYIPFQPTVESLCTNTQCPLTSGPNDRSTSSVWPDNVSGKVVSKIVWAGADGSELLCVQISASVGVNKTALRGSYLASAGAKNYTEDDASAVAEVFRLDAPVELDSSELPNYSSWSPSPFLPQCIVSDSPKDLVLWNNHSLAMTVF
jgi:hypothetical protein